MKFIMICPRGGVVSGGVFTDLSRADLFESGEFILKKL